MQKIDVCVVSEVLAGGVETYIRTVQGECLTNKRVLFLLPNEKNTDHDYLSNLPRVLLYPKVKRIFMPLLLLFLILYIHVLYRPKVFYANSSIAGYTLALYKLLTFCSIKVLYCSHGYASLRERNYIVSKITKLIDLSISYIVNVSIDISTFEFDYATKNHFSRRRVCIEHGLSIADSNDTINTKGILMDDRINILFVGRLDEQKGFDYLYEYFKKNAPDKVHLHVVGASVLGKEVGAHDMHENITFYGWVNNNDIGKYYLASDVVIVPSRWEGFGLVVIESFKYARPVIVSDRGALPGFVTGLNSGYVFKFGDYDSLNEIIVSLKKSELKQLGQNARRIFEVKYTTTKMCRNTVRIINKIVGDSL